MTLQPLCRLDQGNVPQHLLQRGSSHGILTAPFSFDLIFGIHFGLTFVLFLSHRICLFSELVKDYLLSPKPSSDLTNVVCLFVRQ